MPTDAERVGLVGLGVMGRNLGLNLADHGYTVVGCDLSPHAVERFVAQGQPRAIGAASIRDLARALPPPRRVLVMVPAGEPTDQALRALADALEPGDVVIDGGNAYWKDTQRRQRALAERGITLMGCGVSGGADGARHGPSLMCGGPAEGWEAVGPMLLAIAARAPGDGSPCAALVGPEASGHFVKMVHNGIEYADMQLIAEAYWLMKRAMGMDEPAIADVFARWNEGPLASYLIEITARILRRRDARTGLPMVEVIADAAGQKGTGAWTGMVALEMGTPAPTLAEAVFARSASAARERRQALARLLRGPADPRLDPKTWIDRLHDALRCAKISAYAQGFALLADASDALGWGIDLASVARIWRAGCIIRADMLDPMAEALAQHTDLLVSESFGGVLSAGQTAWREIVSAAALAGLPAPATASALAWYDAMRSQRLPASLIQAQRDCFGAHTYERTDTEPGRRFHLDWDTGAEQEVR